MLFLIPRFKQLWDVEGIPWGSLATAVFMMEMMILLMVTYPRLIFYRPGEHMNLLAVCVVSGVVLSMLVVSLNRVKVAADQTQRLEAQLAMSERYYAELTGQLQVNRIRVHDLRHHINTLSGLCAQGNLAEVCGYIATMERWIPAASYRQYCASGAVNALLSHYEAICRQKKIPLDCQVRLPVLERVDPLHLCVIFGNALQNALDALEGLEKDRSPYLRVQATRTQGRIVINVSNPYTGTLRTYKDGLPISSKPEPGHGFGLLSIRETVRRYNGWCGTEGDNQVFILQVVLKDTPVA